MGDPAFSPFCQWLLSLSNAVINVLVRSAVVSGKEIIFLSYRDAYNDLILHIIRDDYPSRELFGRNPFSDRETRLLSPAKKLDIEDSRKSGCCFFGFYVDFLEDTLLTVDGDYCLKRISHSFDDYLQTFKSGENDLESVGSICGWVLNLQAPG